MNWNIIGNGNVAWHFSQLFSTIGEGFLQQNSRNLTQIQEADIYLLAVTDSAIAEVATYFENISPKIIAHTSGTMPLEILDFLTKKNWKTAVFYPLQTLNKNKKIDWQNIPLLVEASNTNTAQILVEIAQKFTKKAQIISSQQRKNIHLAAVISANFTHHLCSLTQQYLHDNNLDIQILAPLLLETIQKASTNPYPTQTGPARRKDRLTIEKHLELLEDYPKLKEFYNLFTKSIGEMY